MSAVHRVHVELADRSYDVALSRGGFEPLAGLWKEAGLGQRAVVITDARVAAHWLDDVRQVLEGASVAVSVLEVPVGEAAKTVEVWSGLVDAVLAGGVDRKTAVVALGGGCVGDVAGFVAASVMRGLPFVQVPTTLLALVDSSVGGKVAVNHALGKNLIGAFHQPRLVFGNLDALSTLPERDFRAGLGEVLKTALLGDAALLQRLSAMGRLTAAHPELMAVVQRCVAIKAEVVAQDEREGGLRAILNAGHTIAHAIEAVTHGDVRHGEAVAMGLVWETRYAIALGVCEDAELADEIRRICGVWGLESSPPSLDHRQLVAAMQLDKKGSGDKLVWPAPLRAGQITLVDLPMSRLPELARSC